MERFEGYTALRDTIRDEEINNWIGFDVGIDRVVFVIGGTSQLSRPTVLTSDNPVVVRMLGSVARTLRVEAYKQRRITAIPKPTRRRTRARGGARCEKCQGTGQYEAVDGTWRDCDWCAHAGRA